MLTFSQTPMPIHRTFNSWLMELRLKKEQAHVQFELDIENAKMYYNGGYSPKMVVHEVLHVPVNEDLFN